MDQKGQIRIRNELKSWLKGQNLFSRGSFATPPPPFHMDPILAGSGTLQVKSGFHFIADSDPAFHFTADPSSHESEHHF